MSFAHQSDNLSLSDRFFFILNMSASQFQISLFPISDDMVISNDQMNNLDTRATTEIDLNFVKRCQDHMPRPFYDQQLE